MMHMVSGTEVIFILYYPMPLVSTLKIRIHMDCLALSPSTMHQDNKSIELDQHCIFNSPTQSMEIIDLLIIKRSLWDHIKRSVLSTSNILFFTTAKQIPPRSPQAFTTVAPI